MRGYAILWENFYTGPVVYVPDSGAGTNDSGICSQHIGRRAPRCDGSAFEELIGGRKDE